MIALHLNGGFLYTLQELPRYIWYFNSSCYGRTSLIPPYLCSNSDKTASVECCRRIHTINKTIKIILNSIIYSITTINEVSLRTTADWGPISCSLLTRSSQAHEQLLAGLRRHRIHPALRYLHYMQCPVKSAMILRSLSIRLQDQDNNILVWVTSLRDTNRLRILCRD